MVRGARWLLWVPVLVPAGYLLLLGVIRAIGMLALPYQAEYGEGPVLDWARQIANGGLPYKPIHTFPYNFSVYTPLYLALSGVFVALFPDNPYFGGRMISLLSALGLGLLLWRATAGGSTTPGTNPLPCLTRPYDGLLTLTGVLLWLVSPYVFRWATFYRPDMLALFWSALGMVLVSRFSFPASHLPQEKGERRKEIFAALCFVLAFFTKQSFFAAPLAALVYLVATKQYKRAVWLGVAGALMGGAAGLGLYAVTGWALVENLIAANANPFSWAAVGRFWWSFVTICPILILLTLWSVRHREHWLWGIYLGIAGIVSLSIGKAGAWENYFLEPLWILCLLATSPPQLASLSGRGGSKTNPCPPLSSMERGAGGVRFLFPILILVQLLLYTRGYERTGIREEWAWLEGVRAEGAALQAAVNAIAAEVPVYSEQMGVLAESGRSVRLHSFVYTQLARQGLWDETDLTTRLAAGDGVVIQRFDAVNDPLERERWSRAMLDAIERGYGFGEQVGEWVIRPPLAQDRFVYPDQPQSLDNRFALLNWEAQSCPVPVECQVGVRPIELFPNGTLTIHTLWQSANEIKTPLSTSVKLIDPSGQWVAQQDGAFRHGWMGKGWAEGAILRDAPRTLELPALLPGGGYSVEVTLYESESGNPLATTRIPYFKVRPDAVPRPPIGLIESRFGSLLTLQGHTPLAEQVRAGETLSVDITYQSSGWQSTRYTTFLHLLREDGTLAAQTDFEPPYPPYAWSEGEQVMISYALTIPPDLPPGRYRLVVGWYDSGTLVRLPVENGRDYVDIGNVLIVE